MFDGKIENGKLVIGEDEVLLAPGLPDQKVNVGIRPEGFILAENGRMKNEMIHPEVTGRDVSILSRNKASQSDVIRSIISAEDWAHIPGEHVRFDLKPYKVFLFEPETGKRIDVELKRIEG